MGDSDRLGRFQSKLADLFGGTAPISIRPLEYVCITPPDVSLRSQSWPSSKGCFCKISASFLSLSCNGLGRGDRLTRSQKKDLHPRKSLIHIPQLLQQVEAQHAPVLPRYNLSRTNATVVATRITETPIIMTTSVETAPLSACVPNWAHADFGGQNGLAVSSSVCCCNSFLFLTAAFVALMFAVLFVLSELLELSPIPAGLPERSKNPVLSISNDCSRSRGSSRIIRPVGLCTSRAAYVFIKSSKINPRIAARTPAWASRRGGDREYCLVIVAFELSKISKNSFCSNSLAVPSL